MDAQANDFVYRVEQIVIGLLAERGYDGPLPSRDMPLAELGFDSLLTIGLVAQIEDELGVEVPDEALTPTSFATLGRTLDVVRPLL